MVRIFRISLVVFSFFVFGVESQAQTGDCSLGISGKDRDIIVQVFQLNEEQVRLLDSWREELETYTVVTEKRVQQLMENHPQKTQSDLVTLADKYAMIQNEVVDTHRYYDQLLLGTFNDKQYAHYTNLCQEVNREPLKPADLSESRNPE